MKMGRVWNAAIQRPQIDFAALESYSEDAERLLKRYDALVSYGSRMESNSKLTLSLAMEGDQLMGSTSMVKLHFDASRGGKYAVAMEEVSAGMWALIAAAVAAVVALIYKVCKWIGGGSFGGGSGGGGGGGGGGGSSSMTAVEVKQVATNVKAVERVVAPVLSHTHEQEVTSRGAAITQTLRERNESEFKKVLDKIHPRTKQVMMDKGIDTSMTELRRALEDAMAQMEKYRDWTHHIGPKMGRDDADLDAISNEIKAEADKLDAAQKLMAQKAGRLMLQIDGSYSHGANAMAAGSFGFDTQVLNKQLMERIVHLLTDPHEVEFAEDKDEFFKMMEGQAEELDRQISQGNNGIEKEIRTMNDAAKSAGLSDHPKHKEAADHMKKMADVMSSLLHPMRRFSLEAARAVRVVAIYQKAVIDGSALIADLLDIQVKSWNEITSGLSKDEATAKWAEKIEAAKKAIQALRAFHHNPASTKVKHEGLYDAFKK
jgi:hypothetical protein